MPPHFGWLRSERSERLETPDVSPQTGLRGFETASDAGRSLSAGMGRCCEIAVSENLGAVEARQVEPVP